MRRQWLRFVDRALASIVVLAALGWNGAATRAQAQPTEEYAPGRFIAADGLFLYSEFDGLDKHADGWRKTAAYRLLNETTTGTMLEDLFSQVVPKSLPASGLSGAEKLQVVKHIARSGFTLGANVVKENETTTGGLVLILHGAFASKEVRPFFARFLQELPNPGTKAQPVVKSGHKMISGQHGQGQFFWWIEETKKEDLILVIGHGGIDEYVLGTYEGKRPSILTSPIHANLGKSQEGFERTGLLLYDPTIVRAINPELARETLTGYVKINRVDFQGGFQGDALMTITRLHSSATKTGVNSSGGFDKATIPGVPAGLPGLMVMALDLKSLPAEIRTNPALGPQYDQWVATFKEKSKIRFEEDILGQLGPKITTYVVPSKTGSSGAMLPNALSLLTKLGAAGPESIPKLAVLIDVANPTKFTNTLDTLISYTNRQLRATFAQPPPGSPGADGMAPPPGPGPGRGRGPGPGPGGPAPEFRVMGGETKSYVFTVPPEFSGTFPASFRPTIRIGPKQVAIALSADVARQALDAKGSYTPPAEITGAFASLPSKLNWLLVADPRESTPEILASLPAKLQAGINTMMTAAPAPGAPTTPANGSPPANRPAGRVMKPGMVMGDADGGASPPPGAQAASPPGSSTTSPPPAGALVLNVSPDKLPSADAIRKILFPAIYTVDEEADAIRFTSRAAFPPIPDPSILGLLVRTYRVRMNPAGISGQPASSPVGTGNLPAPAAAPAPAAGPGPGLPTSRPDREGPGS